MDDVAQDTTSQEPFNGPDSDQPMAQPSKSSLKKAARREKIAATKLERRAKEKLAKKEKKRIKAEKRAAGELDSDDEPKPKKRRVGPPFGGRVVVDLGFDEKMSEKVRVDILLLFLTLNLAVGSAVSLLPAWVHVQREPASWEPLRTRLHFAQWQKPGAPGIPGRCELQTLDKHRVVVRGLRVPLGSRPRREAVARVPHR